MRFQYPPSPEFVSAEKLNPSAAFKKQVVKVIFAIILFFIVYILLIVAAIVLAIACCYIGIKIMTAVANFMALIAGLGLIALGISVIFFLVKFMFAVTKNVNPSRIQITKEEQPELFEFIKRLSVETKTPFPKRIFISPDVNASVFYNSSFWSMLFPVRKNLEIGLGLVNSINISELKAVIAHEFGHFSQRSMKLGSFTYNVNKIIYDMLYNNNSYTKFLNAWARLHRVLNLFARITVKIAQGIQYILRKMYAIINRSYFGLSREMEFHADAVAASVAGGNNVISGLSRIEIASSCYNTVLNKADEWLKDKKRMDNIFDNQLIILKSLASKYDLPCKNELPDVSFDFIQSFSTSRINYKNQWASHPELGERKTHLDALNINVAADESPAWIVFENSQKLQEELTEKLYSNIPSNETLQTVGSSIFSEQYAKETEDSQLPAEYKGFYNGRYFDLKDWDIDELSKCESTKSFDDLFTEANAQLQSSINTNYSDIDLLKAIRDKQINTKSFDFDGVKYSREDCPAIIQQLEEEITGKQEQLKQLDKDVFIFFKKRVSDLDNLYTEFKILSEKVDDYTRNVNDLFHEMQPLYKGGLTLEQIRTTINILKNTYERKLKQQLAILMEEKIISSEKNQKLYDDADSFRQKKYAYFSNEKFINDELNTLRNIAVQTANAYHDYKFKQFKNLLEEQLAGLKSMAS